MRTVTAAVYVSLDGVIDHPEKWSLTYWNEQSAAYQTELLDRTDVLVQGRLTYESLAPLCTQPSAHA